MRTSDQTRSTSPRALTSVEQIQTLMLVSACLAASLKARARPSARQAGGDGDVGRCGVSLRRARKAARSGWGRASAREVDETQYSLSRAPCRTAAQAQREVHVTALLEESRSV